MRMEFFSNRDVDRIALSVQSGNYMAPIFDDFAQNATFRRVCDIGCGTGIFSVHFKLKYGSLLIGIDGSSYALEQAKENGFDETHEVADLSTNDYPIATASCDLVILKDLLEHLLDPVHALREAHRLLLPEGLAFVHVPNHFPFWYRVKFLLTQDIDTQNYFPEAEEWNFPHIRFYTNKGMRALLSATDFEIVHDYSNRFPYVFPLIGRTPAGRSISKVLARTSPSNFSIGLTYLCRKKTH